MTPMCEYRREKMKNPVKIKTIKSGAINGAGGRL